MTRRSFFGLTVVLAVLGFTALRLGPGSVLIRFAHRDFPGGSLTLAGLDPIVLDTGTGSRHFIRWIDRDSSLVLRCGSGADATEEDMGYLTTGLLEYVVLEVEGCAVKRLDISWFP